MPIMIWLAGGVELGIENYVDFWILMGIQVGVHVHTHSFCCCKCFCGLFFCWTIGVTSSPTTSSSMCFFFFLGPTLSVYECVAQLLRNYKGEEEEEEE